MVQKYIAVFLVVMLPGLATPAFAGDYMNTKLLPQRFPLVLEISTAQPPGTTFSEMPGTLAFAPQQSSQDQAQPAQPAQPNSGQWTSGGKKWGGIALMIGGGALLARGAAITDPCTGFSGPDVLCTSNYQTVRATSFAIGGVAVAVGAVLFSLRHHRK
jgi:hypothetical protein